MCSNQGFNNLLNWLTQEKQGVWYRQHEALSLDEALIQAAKMMSSNPARLMENSLDVDELRTGTIAVGKAAEFNLMTLSESDGNYACHWEQIEQVSSTI